MTLVLPAHRQDIWKPWIPQGKGPVTFGLFVRRWGRQVWFTFVELKRCELCWGFRSVQGFEVLGKILKSNLKHTEAKMSALWSHDACLVHRWCCLSMSKTFIGFWFRKWLIHVHWPVYCIILISVQHECLW